MSDEPNKELDVDEETEAQPSAAEPKALPPWKVLLHNDDVNSANYVVETILQLTPLDKHEAEDRMEEAHNEGISLLLTAHKERAEHFQEQFTSKGLTVTIEPGEEE